MLTLVGFYGHRYEAMGGFLGEVKLISCGVEPVAAGSLEDDSIARIEKHLRTASC